MHCKDGKIEINKPLTFSITKTKQQIWMQRKSTWFSWRESKWYVSKGLCRFWGDAVAASRLRQDIRDEHSNFDYINGLTTQSAKILTTTVILKTSSITSDEKIEKMLKRLKPDKLSSFQKFIYPNQYNHKILI